MFKELFRSLSDKISNAWVTLAQVFSDVLRTEDVGKLQFSSKDKKYTECSSKNKYGRWEVVFKNGMKKTVVGFEQDAKNQVNHIKSCKEIK